MFNKLKCFLAVSFLTAFAALPASAQSSLDGAEADIIAGFSTLTLIAAAVISALIGFGVAWYLGKKVYMMTKA